MPALILDEKRKLRLGDILIDESLGPDDVRIRIHTVGICGSDVHYYQHGAIGPFVVRSPMVLGHEASGVIAEVGSAVTHLKKGDRVCMEPGIPTTGSQATRLGLYNLDPLVRFWATPPVHGCLRPSVIHPAAFTFKLPDSVSFAEGALVEPLAVGLHAATKARIKPGDLALVIGAGPIGLLTALTVIASGCSRVWISDVIPEKLALASQLGAIIPIDARTKSVADSIAHATRGWGVDHVFDASGHPQAISQALAAVCSGGCITLIGMPGGPIAFDVVAAQVKEARFETVFRYAHVFPRALELLGSGRIHARSLITDRFDFADSIAAFDYATAMRPTSVKIQIELP